MGGFYGWLLWVDADRWLHSDGMPGVQVEIDTDTTGAMPADELTDLCAWMMATLGDKRVEKVIGSARLVSHPALISDEIGTGTVRRMMRTLDPENLQSIPSQTLEVNPSHNLIKALGELRERDPERAELILEQMYDSNSETVFGPFLTFLSSVPPHARRVPPHARLACPRLAVAPSDDWCLVLATSDAGPDSRFICAVTVL